MSVVLVGPRAITDVVYLKKIYSFRAICVTRALYAVLSMHIMYVL